MNGKSRALNVSWVPETARMVMSTLAGSPIIVTAHGSRLDAFIADFQHLEHRAGNPSHVDYDRSSLPVNLLHARPLSLLQSCCKFVSTAAFVWHDRQYISPLYSVRLPPRYLTYV